MTDATEWDDDEALAGEYVLGLMEPAARRAFEGRLAREPVLRGQVRAWQERLARLADEIAPVAPPPRAKAAIEARLFGGFGRRRWSWTRFAAGVVTAAALMLVLLFQVGPPATTPAIAAEIVAEDRSLVYAVLFDPARDRLQLTRTGGAPVEGRVHELWLIAQGAAVPVSLGVLPDDGRVTLALPEALSAAVPGGTLAVSDEPPGGSPTGQPTGAVLATARVPSG